MLKKFLLGLAVLSLGSMAYAESIKSEAMDGTAATVDAVSDSADAVSKKADQLKRNTHEKIQEEKVKDAEKKLQESKQNGDFSDQMANEWNVAKEKTKLTGQKTVNAVKDSVE